MSLCRRFLLLLALGCFFLSSVGCGSSNTPVTPAPAEGTPTSDAPADGKESVLPEGGP